MKCATQFGFIFGMSHHAAEFSVAVSELTLVTVFAFAVLAELSTQLCLVAAVVDLFGAVTVACAVERCVQILG